MPQGKFNPMTTCLLSLVILQAARTIIVSIQISRKTAIPRRMVMIVKIAMILLTNTTKIHDNSTTESGGKTGNTLNPKPQQASWRLVSHPARSLFTIDPR